MEQSISVWVLGPSPLGLISKGFLFFFCKFGHTVFEKTEMSLGKKKKKIY